MWRSSTSQGSRSPPVENFDLRGATACQVQALQFVDVGRWFPPQWNPRASDGFYTPLHEDFYRAYVDSGISFRPQRVCQLEALVQVVGEQLYPIVGVLQAPVTETAPIVATMSSIPAPAQTQTASLPRVSIEGQPNSLESEEDTSQFVITSRSSAPDTTASVPPSDP
jgi:hypothetical protein